LITKCWDAKAENRPTAKELYQIFNKWNKERLNKDSEIYSQIKESIYTSRLFNFKDLPEPVNTDTIQSASISNCLDCQLSELDLNDENNSD
ncbi:hypothetical protein C1645_875822, partial [Glomus cerebriforme]